MTTQAQEGDRGDGPQPQPSPTRPSTASSDRPEAEAALAERQARRLLELAGSYVRDTLQLPSEVATLRTMLAELLLEAGFLRHDIRRLAERVEALERQRAQTQNRTQATTSARGTAS
jgi:hypothetical protein